MLTPFNRKELISTFDMKEQAEVRSILSSNNIDYDVKTVNRKSASPLWSGTRAYTGSFGEKPEFDYEYTIYVNKHDYDAACELLHNTRN